MNQETDFTEPPHTPIYFHISGEKWDMDQQRNSLLHYIHAKGLDEDCLRWVYESAPEGWFREED